MSCVFLAAARGRIEARITGYNFSFSQSGITEDGITDDFLQAIVSGLLPFCASRWPGTTVKA